MHIANRETILAEFKNRDEAKELFLCALNKDSLSKAIKHKFFNSFDKECKEIQKPMINIKEYDEIIETVPEDKKFNWNGSAINRIMCYYENLILQEVISVINKKGFEIAALMFDGFMVIIMTTRNFFVKLKFKLIQSLKD